MRPGSFIYDGIDFSCWMTTTYVGLDLLPSQRVARVVVPGRTGTVFSRAESGGRTLPVEVLFEPAGHLSYEDTARMVAAHLVKDAPAALQISTIPGYFINAIVEDDTAVNTIGKMRVGGVVTIPFYCPDPYWYVLNDDEITYVAAGTFTMMRRGLAVSAPLLKIEGAIPAGGNHSITVDINGVTVEFTGELSGTDVAWVDCDSMTAWVDSPGGRVSAIADLAALTFPTMRPGENQIVIGQHGSATVTAVTVAARSRSL